ncbi:MAG: biotin/lipoyl-binding protein [Gammaproteobacteria bacterium]|nr:biotin/lipoyl-binding protein [Gammaproteobacteria bacterium]MYD75676.1 biotin/lipoyl-binding protein [Gammaproteobacteria bacterium]MYJ51729.1 biotin/lipoyl-binding protein [Gammaproteobacteria bacterium]
MNKNPVFLLLTSISLLVAAPVFGDMAGRVSHERIYRLGVGISGEIHSIPHRQGDRVEQGTVLLKLEDAHLSAAVKAAESGLESAEARLEQADRAYDRDVELYDEGSLSLSELEESESTRRERVHAVDLRAAMLALRKHELESSRITAPEAGVLLDSSASRGERVVPEADPAAQILFGAGVKVLEIPLGGQDGPMPVSGETVRLTDMSGNTADAMVRRVEVRAMSGALRLYLDNPDQLPDYGTVVTISR